MIVELVAGVALVLVSVPVVTNWRGAAVRYSDFADLIQPYRSRRVMRRGSDPGIDWHRYVLRMRIIFAALGCGGIVLVLAGLAAA